MLNTVTAFERLDVFDTQMDRLLANPLFGEGGSGAFSISGTTTISHNFYMTLVLHTGLVGLVLYFAPIVLIMFRTRKWLRASITDALLRRRRNLVIVLWLSVIGIMINGMFMELRIFGFVMAFFWFILGMIASITAWPRPAYDLSGDSAKCSINHLNHSIPLIPSSN
jgi:O-antigen ligase